MISKFPSEYDRKVPRVFSIHERKDIYGNDDNRPLAC